MALDSEVAFPPLPAPGLRLSQLTLGWFLRSSFSNKVVACINSSWLLSCSVPGGWNRHPRESLHTMRARHCSRCVRRTGRFAPDNGATLKGGVANFSFGERHEGRSRIVCGAGGLYPEELRLAGARHQVCACLSRTGRRRSALGLLL